ncbi:MAG: Fic family protein [Thiovulaceae bacterium]|nr:Fic family protein [Sulfurimonadaceae bacterium]
MSFIRELPYNNLPLLWPSENLWKTFDVFEKLNAANKALAELKGHLSAIPNPHIFIHTLSLQEAKESSEIENIFTTNDKLFKAYTTDKATDRSTKEILRYGKALTQAHEQLKSSKAFSISFVEDIYRTIKDETDGIREKEVYIGNDFETIYTPPSSRAVLLEKLDNWIEKANEDSAMDPLIKMAFLHYQFEAIHPFKDGNGRTGRVLNMLYLAEQNLLNEPVLYLSKYINAYKTQYYTLLREVTEEQAWEAWLLYILEAIRATAQYTLKKVKAIETLFEQTRQQIQEKAPNVYSYELLEVLFTQVYCKYEFLIQRKIASRNTASNYFNQLVDLGLLEKEKVGTELIFKNVALYELFRHE